MPTLPKGIKFEVASKSTGKKYIAILPDNKKVYFGARGYEHFKDSVPKKLGGGKWKHKDHLNLDRRRNYRKRHRGVLTKLGRPAYKVRYSPSWFSYYFLW